VWFLRNASLRYLYTVLFYLALPFIFLRLLWRSRKAVDYRYRWLERLGFCPHKLEKCIWIHAVSLGETIAAVPLIKALKIDYPHIPLLVTNMTLTGASHVKAVFGDAVFQAYVPYDIPDAILRFIKRVNPLILIVMETELWPNLFAACKKQFIPIFVTNARLSQKSANGYRRILPMTQTMLKSINLLAVQGKADATRFIELGMSADKVKITGNLKFDLELPLDLFMKSENLRLELGRDRFIWIAASTHHTEEEIILAAHALILQRIPEALLLLVPRHPERFDAVASLSEKRGFHTARRSRYDICTKDTSVYIGDSTGEMMLLYAVSDVAFVAGSFAPIGGHNMLEPAVLGKPIITGPHLHNFAEVSQFLLAENGMVQVENAEELADTVVRFYREPEYRKRVGHHAFQFVEANRGALQKQIECVRKLLI
jgi:3-deoxy-D-manno-octulosonic-acid transferase